MSQVVKQRMQTGQFTSAPDAVRLIVSKEGFKGLYAVIIFLSLSLDASVLFAPNFKSGMLMSTLQGYRSFLLRDLPFDAIQFCLYEQIRLGYKLAVSFLVFLSN